MNKIFATPKNRQRYLILGICRISTEHQDKASLDDQKALYIRWLDEHFGVGNYELRIIASRGSGEILDRQELLDAFDMVEAGNLDFVICEDLGRICRRNYVIQFIEHCLDHNTHVIAINDQMDTREDNWRLSSQFAAMRHEAYNADTAKRIRRTQINRYHQGGQLPCQIYGYVKPLGAKHENEITKDPDAEPIYDMIFTMLEQGVSYSVVADKLNELGVPTGPICKIKKWNCAMVTRIVNNPILKGIRVHNRNVSKRINKTGRRKSVKAPPGEMLQRHVPHLQFIDLQRYDRVIYMLKKRNAHFSRNKTGFDPLKDRPKKRTVWPGQHLYCGICGRLMVYGKSKGRAHFDCSGSRDYECWNGLDLNAHKARTKLLAAIFAEIASLPDFDDALRANLHGEVEAALKNADQRRSALVAELAVKRRAVENVLATLEKVPDSPALLQRLNEREAEILDLQHAIAELDAQRPEIPELPTIDDMRKLFAEELQRLPCESPDFSLLLHKLVDKFVVYPLEIVDKQAGYYLRAHFRLKLWPLMPTLGKVPALAEHLVRELRVDLFDPPQRVRYLWEVIKSRAEGETEKEISQRLGIDRSVAQLAAALHRKMTKLGLTEPFRYMTEPPTRQTKLRRHLHPRYVFRPLITPEPSDDISDAA